jgi:hypothetical protein
MKSIIFVPVFVAQFTCSYAIGNSPAPISQALDMSRSTPLQDSANSHVEPRQEHGYDMGAKEGVHDMGVMSGGMGGGGMGGIGAVDLSNPYISSIISTMLKYGTGMLPKMPLNKTEELTPTSKRTGARRTKFWYGPLNIETVGASLPLRSSQLSLTVRPSTK